MALQFTNENFQSEVLESSVPVLVDFWAEWCGPCRLVSPIIDELSTDYDGKALIGKVNVDHNAQVASKYNVRSIPTILFLKNGEIVDKQVGATTKAALEQKIAAFI